MNISDDKSCTTKQTTPMQVDFFIIIVVCLLFSVFYDAFLYEKASILGFNNKDTPTDEQMKKLKNNENISAIAVCYKQGLLLGLEETNFSLKALYRVAFCDLRVIIKHMITNSLEDSCELAYILAHNSGIVLRRYHTDLPDYYDEDFIPALLENFHVYILDFLDINVPLYWNRKDGETVESEAEQNENSYSLQ